MRYPQIKWSKVNLTLLGKISDGELAKKMNVSKYTVFMKRTILKIKPYIGKNTRRVWLASEILLLGTMKDSEVAIIVGVTPNTVFVNRKKLNIPAFGGK